MSENIQNNQNQTIEWSTGRKWLAATSIVVALTSAVAFAVLMGIDNGRLRPAFKPWAISAVGLSAAGITIASLTLIDPLWTAKQRRAEKQLKVITQWKRVVEENRNYRNECAAKCAAKWRAIVAERKEKREKIENEKLKVLEQKAIEHCNNVRAKRAIAKWRASAAQHKKERLSTLIGRVRETAKGEGVVAAGAAGVTQAVDDLSLRNGPVAFMFAGVRATYTAACHLFKGNETAETPGE